VVVVIVAFIAGLIVGVVGGHLLFMHHLLFPKGFVARRIVDRLDHELHLTPQQKAQVQQIIDRHHVRIEALMRGVRPQIRQEIDASNAEIEKILTPDQRAKFSRMRMRMPGGRHEMPPPPPPD
jgi:Spy/CpxP family protein refolding chaperone